MVPVDFKYVVDIVVPPSDESSCNGIMMVSAPGLAYKALADVSPVEVHVCDTWSTVGKLSTDCNVLDGSIDIAESSCEDT